RFFDLKNKFSDVSAPFPTTFPSAEQFSKSSRELGIDRNSAIVIYDDKGIYSSPRAWWLFKAFGHDNAAVLDGGLPAWQNANYKVENKQNYKGPFGTFKAKLRPGLMKFFEDVKKESLDAKYTIVDARSEARFKGLVPEPREGLRSGTIPNSVNIPYTELFKDYCFKTKDELRSVFEALAIPGSNLTFTCGSGITACVLALGAELLDYQNLSVYDGSWTEWGSLVEE
ncbi:MAG TPA: rhodanese-like domain-containing protein, partial [Flavobacteriaceae bacterium]|nr:rhodanese-like domain-containing protein [Flavobacteriaceae bacterium]